MSSTKGSLMGYLREPQRTECSDVRDAGGVGRGRAEGDAEGLVLVIVGQGHHLRTRLLVLEEEHLGVVLGDVLLAKELEPVQVGGGLELDRGDRGGDRLAVQAAPGDDTGGWGAAKRGADGRGGGEPDAEAVADAIDIAAAIADELLCVRGVGRRRVREPMRPR